MISSYGIGSTLIYRNNYHYFNLLSYYDLNISSHITNNNFSLIQSNISTRVDGISFISIMISSSLICYHALLHHAKYLYAYFLFLIQSPLNSYLFTENRIISCFSIKIHSNSKNC